MDWTGLLKDLTTMALVADKYSGKKVAVVEAMRPAMQLQQYDGGRASPHRGRGRGRQRTPAPAPTPGGLAWQQSHRVFIAYSDTAN